MQKTRNVVVKQLSLSLRRYSSERVSRDQISLTTAQHVTRAISQELSVNNHNNQQRLSDLYVMRANSYLQQKRHSLVFSDAQCVLQLNNGNSWVAHGLIAEAAKSIGYNHLALIHYSLAISQCRTCRSDKKLLMDSLKQLQQVIGNETDVRPQDLDFPYFPERRAKLPSDDKHLYRKLTENCDSVRIGDCPTTMGRGVFAIRDIAKGEVISSELPIVANSVDHGYCDNCLEKITHSHVNCDSCTTEHYCSEKCRDEAGRKWHKVLCGKDFSSLKDTVRNSKLPMSRVSLLVPRIYAMSKNPQQNHTELSLVDALCSWSDTNRKPVPMSELLTREYSIEKQILGTEYDPEYGFEWYVQLKHSLIVNAFSTFSSVKKDSADGIALYGLTSFYNHSCNANTCVRFTSSVRIEVVANRDVKSGEQIFINYLGGVDASCEQKSKMLYSSYGFNCGCCPVPSPN